MKSVKRTLRFAIVLVIILGIILFTLGTELLSVDSNPMAAYVVIGVGLLGIAFAISYA